MTQESNVLGLETTLVGVKLQVHLFHTLKHHPDVLQMVLPISAMDVDIINKDLQELVAPIFKNLNHGS